MPIPSSASAVASQAICSEADPSPLEGIDASAGQWMFNLGTKPFTAPGTYTVTAGAGATSYALAPTCSGEFVRNP